MASQKNQLLVLRVMVLPFGIIEFGAGFSVTGRESAYAEFMIDRPAGSAVDIIMTTIMDNAEINA